MGYYVLSACRLVLYMCLRSSRFRFARSADHGPAGFLARVPFLHSFDHEKRPGFFGAPVFTVFRSLLRRPATRRLKENACPALDTVCAAVPPPLALEIHGIRALLCAWPPPVATVS